MPTGSSGVAKGFVSIWIGNFKDELDLDGYLGPEFEADHGLTKAEGEYAIHKVDVPLRELLEAFFLSERWIAAALDIATSKGETTASCAVVRTHYRHEPSAPSAGPLRFLGCVALG